MVADLPFWCPDPHLPHAQGCCCGLWLQTLGHSPHVESESLSSPCKFEQAYDYLSTEWQKCPDHEWLCCFQFTRILGFGAQGLLCCGKPEPVGSPLSDTAVNSTHWAQLPHLPSRGECPAGKPSVEKALNAHPSPIYGSLPCWGWSSGSRDKPSHEPCQHSQPTTLTVLRALCWANLLEHTCGSSSVAGLSSGGDFGSSLKNHR